MHKYVAARAVQHAQVAQEAQMSRRNAGHPVGGAEVEAGDDNEADHDSGRLHHLATVRPLYPLQLAPASLKEVYEAVAGDGPGLAGGRSRDRHRTGFGLGG